MLLWAAGEVLDEASAEMISTRSDQVWVSAATIWEIEIKRSTGRLNVPTDVLEMLDESGFERLPITLEHALAAGRLPLHHRDPFDRMLVAQARAEGLTLATSDATLAEYDVPLVPVSRVGD